MPSLIKKRLHGEDAPGDQQSTLKMRRSCDACALAKRRCDGELRCLLCCKKSIRCVYSTRQKSGPKGHKAPAESVAATATTSISSTTTTDKPIKRRKTSKKPSKKQASAAAAPSTTTGWHHQQQQSSLLKTVPPGTPADLAPSPTAPVAPASPSLSKGQQLAAPGRRHPSQQVARKEPRPRHHRKDADGKEIPAVKSPAPAAAAANAVVSPSNGTATSRFARQQPVAPALPAQFPSLARSKSSAAEETVGGKFAPLPRMVPRRGSSVSAPGSGSSVDGSSSSLSWDDVQDVFVSSLEDDVLWSCDDFSDDDRAEGWASVGVASDNRSPGGFDWIPSYVEENATPLNDAPKALEAILMATEQASVLTTDQTATTAAPRPAGRFAGQPPPSAALAPQEPMMYQMLPSRAFSPNVVFAQRSPGAGGGYGGGCESNGGLPPSAKISDEVEPIVVDVLPAAGGSSSSSSGMLQNSSGGISDSEAADCGDGACSPISGWTPEAVVAGASTLLAVLSDADFCSSVRSDILAGGNGWGVERRHQQHQQQRNDDSSTRWSWPPRDLRANYGMAPRSPPGATPTLVVDGSWHTPTDGAAVSENNRDHCYHRQQQRQQQQQQQGLALAPPDILSLVKELSTPSDGGGTAARRGKGSKRYRTATL
ncbi:unnamed protein product [Ectocarpus sp. CCAP 1310/34]|nr:unnamed protein product [Ectocarpus sp. CCAP 1310/34]